MILRGIDGSRLLRGRGLSPVKLCVNSSPPGQRSVHSVHFHTDSLLQKEMLPFVNLARPYFLVHRFILIPKPSTTLPINWHRYNTGNPGCSCVLDAVLVSNLRDKINYKKKEKKKNRGSVGFSRKSRYITGEMDAQRRLLAM